MLGHMSFDIIFSSKLADNERGQRIRAYFRIKWRLLFVYRCNTVFGENSSRKIASFEEQIISTFKYPSTFFARNGGCCVSYPSNMFFATSAVLKIGEHYSNIPQF